MDASKLLKTVNNLNDYITATQDVVNKLSNSKIQFNMSTVLALKKIRSIEIEYFNKYEENGAAVKILELMLRLPPSKTWGLLGKELISLMQYWLDAIRKHLIAHSIHWWNFLSIILTFIQEIRVKNKCIVNILVQDTSESLLDLATCPQPNLNQRCKIVQCLNSCCAESSREIRLALRNKYENYFVKLSSILVSCGDLCTQYCIMETLMRWLLPRQDVAVRRNAALKWFPDSLYNRQPVEIFLRRQWQNFFKDARDFLNALNNSGDHIISVLCRKFFIGHIGLIPGTDQKDYWIDLNLGSKCISLMLEPRLLEALGTSLSICHALVISEDNTNTAEMLRQSSETIISLSVIDPLRMYSSNLLENNNDIRITISSRSDMARVDKALRSIFDSKYQLLINIEESSALSPRDAQGIDTAAENDTRFSHPVEIKRRKHSGYIVRSRNIDPLKSPSTASTSSLAMLRDKLTAFPRYNFDKEPVAVCASPQLSRVTEVDEVDDRNSSQSTLKLFRPCGVCHKKNKNTNQSQSDSEGTGDKHRKCISPIINDEENSISCLLLATIGSESVINDTLERLPKDKDVTTDNIVDLLAKEAFESICEINKDYSDMASGKNMGNQDGSDAIENAMSTEFAKNVNKNVIINNKANGNKSTSEESITEVVEDTQQLAAIKKSKETKKIMSSKKVENKEDSSDNAVKQQSFDIQAMEEFFSQHFAENRNGDLVISPILARKINETSSECSEEFELRPAMNVVTEFNLSDIDIVECLNDIVDKVCMDFEKCAELYNKDVDVIVPENDEKEAGLPETPLKELTNISRPDSKTKKQVVPKNVKKPIKAVKLKFTNNNNVPNTRGKKKNINLKTEPVKRMSPISERDSAIQENEMQVKKSPEVVVSNLNEFQTPLTKRKRKLYSPKDDHIVNEKSGAYVSETEDDNTLDTVFKINDKTSKTKATSYKELESLRKKSARKLRNRKSRIEPTLSPRTKKMDDMFENLKKIEDSDEKISFVDKKLNKRTRNKQLEVYNFTSDSDDEDFKTNKVVKNQKSTTTIVSTDSVKNRRARKSNKDNPESKIDACESVNKNAKKRTCRPKADRKVRITKPKNEMIDERMRQANQDALNTSLVVEPKKKEAEKIVVQEPEPIIYTKPQMEAINTNNDIRSEISNNSITLRRKTTRSTKKTDLSTNKGKVIKDAATKVKNSNSGSVSPLPGLTIEADTVGKEGDDSITAAMLEKFKDIGQNRILNISELNTTQNLLSDLEHINSPPKLNITDELNIIAEEEVQVTTPVKRLKSDKIKTSAPSSFRFVKNNPKKIKTVTNINKFKNNIDAINISERTENDSEKSIVTVGKSPITAHGECEESPPNSQELDEKIQPRNLETEYFNKSMKDYFDKLTQELYDLPQNISSAKLDKEKSDKNKRSRVVENTPPKEIRNVAEKSPSVRITRLSPKEISQFLPRFNSILGSDQSSSEVSTIKTRNKKNAKSNEETFKSFKTSSKNVQNIRNTNVTPIKLYSETEKEKSVLSEKDDYLEHIRSIMTTSKKQITKAEINRIPRYNLRERSFGSPKSQPSLKSADSICNKEDDYVKLIRNRMATKENITETEFQIQETPRYNLRKRSFECPKVESNLKSDDSASIELSKSSKVSEKIVRKKKISSPVIEINKRRRVEGSIDQVILTDSEPSGSSVDDWLKRNERTSRVETKDLSKVLKDNLDNILERLDTTLLEIHHKTSRNFVSLFVDTQKQLNEMKEYQQQLYRDTAKDIIINVVQIMDAKFAEMDRRSQEKNQQFMSDLQERARKFIHEDCKKKRAMVTILRQDVQAIKEHLGKTS